MLNLPPIPKRNSGLRLFLQTVIGRSYPRIIGMQREKSWLFFDVLFPLGSVIAYVLVYRAIGAPEDYVGFVVVGGAMIAFWANVLWAMSAQLYWEKEQGNLALYIISPAPLMGILLGMALGGFVATALRAGAIILIGSLMFQVQYAISSLPQLVAVFIASMVALYGLGMIASSAYLLLSREAWHVNNLLVEPIYLLSGFYFPIKNFPFIVMMAASFLPLTLGLDAMRQLAFTSGPSLGYLSVQVELLILLGMSALFVVAARFLLRYMERLAAREGRLTERRA